MFVYQYFYFNTQDPGHGQVFIPPHFYFGRDYPPLPGIDHPSFHSHSAASLPPTQSDLLHRFVAPPPVSPRLIEAAYHRRSSNPTEPPLQHHHHGSVMNAREYEAAVAADRRSYEERRELEHHHHQQQQQHQQQLKEQHQRPTSIDMLKRKHHSHSEEPTYGKIISMFLYHCLTFHVDKNCNSF